MCRQKSLLSYLVVYVPNRFSENLDLCHFRTKKQQNLIYKGSTRSQSASECKTLETLISLLEIYVPDSNSIDLQ